MKLNIRTSVQRCPDVLHVMAQESESGIKEEENKLLDIIIKYKDVKEKQTLQEVW